MKIYTRGILGMLLGIIGAHVAGFLLYSILTIFISEFLAAILSLIVYFAILYITIFSDNIKFILNEEAKLFSYYKNRKFVKEYDLKNVVLSYKIVTGKSGNTLDLFIDEDRIDCEPLGMRTFERMYTDLEEVAEVKPVFLKVGDGKK